MCVCMDAEAIIDKGVLSGKETTIIVYTRKRKQQKLGASATDGPSNSVVSANGEAKISVFKDDNATHQARVDKLDGQDGKDRIFIEEKPLAVVSKGECSEIDISREQNAGEEVVADVPAEGLSSGVKEGEDGSQISCVNEDGLQTHASCESGRHDDPVPNGDLETEPQLDDISSVQEPSGGKVRKDAPLELQPNGEGEPMLDCRGESPSLDISKEDNEGGVEEAVVDGLPLGHSSGVEEVKDRTQISDGNEDELHIHASSEPDMCGNPVVNSDQEFEPQLDISSNQEPSAGKLLRDDPMELHPNGEGEPMLDCPVSDDNQEMNSNHVNETSSDQALESSRRDSCKVFTPNSNEDPGQLPDDRWEPPPGGGKVKLPSGATGPQSHGVDSHVNHQDVDIPEAVLSKPLISLNEDKVYIALNESSSKDELLSLKRKLESELDQVRRVARKVDEKELQVVAYNERNMTNPAVVSGSEVSDFSVYNQQQLMMIGHSSMESVGHPVMENSHEFVENGMRTPNIFAQTHPTLMPSSVRSYGHLETRPFRQFNGSLTENNHEDGEFVDRDKRTPKANTYYMNADFYLEGDRLPVENHNKNGPSKKRRLGGEYGVSFGFGGDKDGNKLFKDCSNLLQRLMKHKNGWVFNNPVDPFVLGIPDYLDIIKHPMDLGTIKTRLTKKQYASAIEFTEDVRLVFSNAMTYNPKGHEVHTWAEELLKIFEDRWVSIENGYRRKKQHNKPGYFPARRQYYMPAPFFPPVTVPPPAHSPAIGHAPITPPMTIVPDSITVPVNPMVRPAVFNIPRVRRTPALPKPKANEPNKRNMTNEEKQRLSNNLQSLPQDRIDVVLQIMKKRSADISQNDDEIEVDIDSVDVETLWELDRYVTNFKKSYSKYRRRAEKLLAQQEAAAAAVAAPAAPAHNTNQVPAPLVSENECITGVGNIESAPIEVETHANRNASSSSSSSSSSDSGSSSSDSDSDTSSDDEVDVGHSPGA